MKLSLFSFMYFIYLSALCLIVSISARVHDLANSNMIITS